MRISLKSKLAIGTTALAAAAFAGGAYAATQNSPGGVRQAFLNDVAKRLGVSPAQLSSALKGAYDDQLQAAVAAGKLTQAQANAIKQRAKDNGIPPLGGFGLLGPPASGGKPFAGPGPRPLAFGGSLKAAATYLGLTESQLAQDLSGGKTLAQIATARGKSVAGLEASLSAAAKTKLDKLVAGKVITSAQEQQAISRLSAAIADVVNGHPPGPGLGPRRGLGPRLFGAPNQGAGRAGPGTGPQGGPPPWGGRQPGGLGSLFASPPPKPSA
jgi:hypothetical protein